jgi:hypothetical protein
MLKYRKRDMKREREREREKGSGCLFTRDALRQSDYYRDKNKTPFASSFLPDARLSVKHRDIKIFPATPY